MHFYERTPALKDVSYEDKKKLIKKVTDHIAKNRREWLLMRERDLLKFMLYASKLFQRVNKIRLVGLTEKTEWIKVNSYQH